MALHKEGTAEGYLGVNIKQEGNQVTLRQKDLTKCIIEALGLDSKYSMPVKTPADTATLRKDIGGEESSGSINYPSIIGMHCIWNTVVQTFLSPPTNVQGTRTCQSYPIRMP